MSTVGRFSRIVAMAFVLGAASSALAAEEGVWSVSKSSGEVWMTTTGAQPVSLGKEEVLKPVTASGPVAPGGCCWCAARKRS